MVFSFKFNNNLLSLRKRMMSMESYILNGDPMANKVMLTVCINCSYKLLSVNTSYHPSSPICLNHFILKKQIYDDITL